MPEDLHLGELMRWLLLIVALATVPVACGPVDDVSPGSLAGIGGGAGLPGDEPGGAHPGDGGAGGAPVAAGLRCDRCGATRDVCASTLAACAADDQCGALLECVYGPRGCALDAGGATCVEGCARAGCSSPDAVALFLEADRCIYCTSACRGACDSYCDALDHDAFSCPEAGGAGGDATVSNGGPAGRGGSAGG